MGGLIPEEIIETVRLHTDIVQVVGEYVHLERKGKNYSGFCPFHQEKDPSFTVSPDRQIFHCFGCGTGGNVFKFLMLAESLTFPEAVRQLAARCGVPVPETAVHSGKARRQERAWLVNGMARDFYRHLLLHRPEGRAARDYLAGRGLSPGVQESYQLGYAPPEWNGLTRFLTARNCTPEELIELGLAMPGKRGCYDRFRDRIIFPIWDARGRVIGFGGRVLGDGAPKYLNTAETPVFSKSHVLYGLHLARPAIQQQGFAVMMEGYMDVIAAHQFGVSNAVASLGTSLTGGQIELLKRYTANVVIAYDADAAGQSAALRGMELLLQADCRVKVATVPEGKDPDDFLRRYGAAGWRDLLSRAEPLLEYRLRRGMARGDDTDRLLQEVLPGLARAGEVEQEEGIRLLAARLSLSWETVKNALGRYLDEQGKKWSNPDKIAKNTHNIIKSKPRTDAIHRSEQALISCIAREPSLIVAVRRELGAWEPRDEVLRAIYQLLCRDGTGTSPDAWMDRLEDAGQQLLSRLLLTGNSGAEPAEILPGLIETVKKRTRQEQKMHLMQELAEAERMQDRERINCILEKLNHILGRDAGRPHREGES
ncbi:DNA primase [Desulfotomaculum copahuensis]|uniref:DNA primase n=1 Tax=Desulfotomaculum copahuensis TaxID=1838280 RepID=A0A1B7LHN6_9FIRM|nr:DNA primase [Desulfotomaculum copahuensis]OAT85810.1 DNA primase [Desulfotomaculum copahuensis]